MSDNNLLHLDGSDSQVGRKPPESFAAEVQADITRAGGEIPIDPEMAGAIGATMFDLPGSEDNSVTVLLPQSMAQRAPSQSLVRIKSRGDKRRYLGIVTAGPFAEPDVLRGDSHLLVTISTRGGLYLPPYHGRAQVTILGEELIDETKPDEVTMVPPRLRPLPNSPVFLLDEAESAKVLRSAGDLRLGLVVGHREVPVGIPSSVKAVLPRHLAILGTTGGGKSTTVARLVQQAQEAGMAVILLDVEGEYTRLNEPTEDPRMKKALAERKLEPRGVPTDQMTLYHLVGRDTTNPRHPNRNEFSLQFARLSPYAISEMLGMSEAQVDRFFFAYEVTKSVMRDVGIFPQSGLAKEEMDRQERQILRIDEFQRGHPRMPLSLLIDVVSICLAKVGKTEFRPWHQALQSDKGKSGCSVFRSALSDKV